MGLQTFPGTYTQVRDDSFFSTPASRFRGGFIGAAEKGPVNELTAIGSFRDYVRKFGKSIPGHYLTHACQVAADLSDGITVVRIAREYEIITGSGAGLATGSEGLFVVTTPNAPLFSVGEYARVSQTGLESTVNARIQSKTSTTLTFTSDTPLAATYTGANVDQSTVENAANKAEAFLEIPVWATDPIGGVSTPLTIEGDKSMFSAEVVANASELSNLDVGDLLKIEQEGFATTREIMVSRIIPAAAGENARIEFEPVNKTEMGYQAIALQDSYSAGIVYKISSYERGAHLLAASPGTWANSDGSRTGLIVKVSPGNTPDTKTLLVYENSALVEEIENLSNDPASEDYFETRINGKSSFISITMLSDGIEEPFANTRTPWNTTYTTRNVAGFVKGFNGENVTAADYIGTINPATEVPTGLKLFEDLENNNRPAVLAAPGVTDLAVFQEMDRINRKINALGLVDPPAGLNLRQATDWHLGEGLWRGQGKLDTYTLAIYWNWGTLVDATNGERISVPPTIGALRTMAYTFDAEKPWISSAGEKRGLIPEFLALENRWSSEDAKQASYGKGRCLNSILLNNNRIMLWGNRTTQRTESKLTAVNNVILVNYVVNGLAQILRKYLFDPLDEILYDQMRADAIQFLNSIKAERGIEEYNLVLDKTNNSAEDRNNRRAILDLYIVPLDPMEKLFINATVRESGASLNAVR